MNLANPREAFSIVRNQTFALENQLVRATAKDGFEPLKFYHKKFARFPAVIINDKHKAATGNIPVRDIPDILKRGSFAYNKELENSMQPVNEDTSPAYKVIIPSGSLKGKTPAQVLIEQGSEQGIKALQQHYNWLKSNLNKYPKNKEQMDAIADAVKLESENKLDANNSSSTGIFDIYTPGLRPLNRKNKNDLFFVYEIKMYWQFGNRYPFVVEITNFYAPVKTEENGMKKVMVKDKDTSSEIKNTMYLSASEYAQMEYMIKTNMRTFEDMMAKIAYNEAEQEYQNNLAEARTKSA